MEQASFDKTSPDFHCLVAENTGKIVGIAVYYFLPFTAQNRPAIYLKELYVDQNYRGQKLREKLMLALKQET